MIFLNNSSMLLLFCCGWKFLTESKLLNDFSDIDKVKSLEEVSLLSELYYVLFTSTFVQCNEQALPLDTSFLQCLKLSHLSIEKRYHYPFYNLQRISSFQVFQNINFIILDRKKFDCFKSLFLFYFSILCLAIRAKIWTT